MSPNLSLRRLGFLLLRSAFRLTPMSVALRDRLRQRWIDRYADRLPPGPRGQILVDNDHPHRPYAYSGGRAIGYVPYRRDSLPSPLPATLIAFYLPQFHPIAQNDAWWGEGFTEWNNVTRALPQVEGHAQPRLPGVLGYYDLRQTEIMRQQMQLAHAYGIGAFCSYFYWFAGETLLEQPLRQWLADTTLELPLCLCWANENWSRRWDGRADEVLIAQKHSPQDDLAFIAHIATYMRDPRYLRVNGVPLLLVYRPGLLPDPKATAQRWREWCLAHGIGKIHLAYVQSFDNVDPRSIGFDSAVEFPPNNIVLPPITGRQRLINHDFKGEVYDWRELFRQAANKGDPTYPLFPCVNPGWDNEPRRSGRGRIFLHHSPRGYRDWLRQAIAIAHRRFPQAAAPLVFINAWNEWAEGAVLEPDARLGHAWLDATRQALRPQQPSATKKHHACVVIHAWYPELLAEIDGYLKACILDWRIVVTTAQERADAVRQATHALKWEAEIHVFENRGRDILPFLKVANKLLDEGEDVVLKLHTKRSDHRQDGDQWRKELLDRLAAPARAKAIVEGFAQQQELGLVYPEGHRQPLDFYWGANRDKVEYLTVRLGIPPANPEKDHFVAGSMSWLRLAALRPLLDAHLDEWEFEPEQRQLDGTMAHAIERIIGLTVDAGNYLQCSAAHLCGEAATGEGDHYPYARRG